MLCRVFHWAGLHFANYWLFLVLVNLSTCMTSYLLLPFVPFTVCLLFSIQLVFQANKLLVSCLPGFKLSSNMEDLPKQTGQYIPGILLHVVYLLYYIINSCPHWLAMPASLCSEGLCVHISRATKGHWSNQVSLLWMFTHARSVYVVTPTTLCHTYLCVSHVFLEGLKHPPPLTSPPL